MKSYSLLFCLLSFSIYIYSASADLKTKFRKDVLSQSVKSLEEKSKAAIALGSYSLEYDEAFQALIEEGVDFCEVVCDGATHYHEKKIDIDAMRIALVRLKKRRLTQTSKEYVQQVRSLFKF